ncbi:hypothetical protein FRC04_007088 [Tulasnella sp. 424]|nr:hypothetical protein FRC04_007088 [Tulasnella sp. 424]KAG8976890.1 hypothetical protein FRC05_002827 [Tulasnella sp. 425]
MLFSVTLLTLIGSTITFPSASAFNGQYSRKREPLQPLQTPEEQKYNKNHNFTQLIDHSNPSAGGFRQRYFFSDQYYKGQGSPIIITTPGEQSADGFYTDLTGSTLLNAMLKEWGAAGVILEYRYWGKSSPFDRLTTENLAFLTVNQTIEDYKYFIENVDLPWSRGSGSYNSKPSVTPWVNMGCSYPGQLVTIVQQKYPDLFAAGYATSAPVNASGNFWEYWKPIEDGMPKNCTSDLTAAVAHVDQVMSKGTPDEINALKENFGMKALANDDFGNSLRFPFDEWQHAKPSDFKDGRYSNVFKLCDAIEKFSDGSPNTSAQGVGVSQALENWAEASKTLFADAHCPKSDGACHDTSDPNSEVYTNTAVSDTYRRAWVWLLCTQLGWFQPGSPGKFSISSGQVTPAYYERQCSYYFPLTNGTPPNYNLAESTKAFNAEFKSWNVVGKNLYSVNGQFDPWRPVSLASDSAPPFVNTATQKATVIPNGIHCWDWEWSYGDINPDIRAVQSDGLHQVGIWLRNWYANHPDVVKPFTAMRVQAIGEAYDINETHEAVLNNLEDKVDGSFTKKTLTITSYGLNGVLALSAIVALVLFVITKRAEPKPSSIPRWSTENEGIPQRELGEKYQHLKVQTV